MNFAFISVAFLDTMKEKGQLQDQTPSNPKYFKYLRRICPHHSDNPITFDRAVTKFQKKFSLHYEQAKKIIQLFIDEKILSIGLDNDIQLNLLANATRSEIYDLIHKYPGVYISVIRNHLRLGTNQTLWHLAILVEFKYIKEHSFGNIKTFCIPNCPEGNVLIGFLILKKSLRNILSIINENRFGLAISKLEEITKKSRSSLYYTLNKLIKWNVIQKCEENINNYRVSFDYIALIEDNIKKFEELFRKKPEKKTK